MRNVLGESCRENQNTHFVLNKFFSFENCAVYEIMWGKKFYGDGQATGNSMAHAYSMLDT
jgi:hypothetical protein